MVTEVPRGSKYTHSTSRLTVRMMRMDKGTYKCVCVLLHFRDGCGTCSGQQEMCFVQVKKRERKGCECACVSSRFMERSNDDPLVVITFLGTSRFAHLSVPMNRVRFFLQI